MTPLTVKDMAIRLQVKDKTIYAWASQGKMPCVKVNGVIRFDRGSHRAMAPEMPRAGRTTSHASKEAQ